MAIQAKQGVSIEERMHSRIVTWAVGKWNCLSEHRNAKMAQAIQRLQHRCTEKIHDIPKFQLRRLRGILLSWPAKCGLGLDMWVLRLLGTQPDEGLTKILAIIHMAFRGKVPMQMLLTLIGLIPKTDGGERPIALTSMVYRVCMKLCKGTCDQWDARAAGHWDTAVKNSSCLRAALARALRMEAAVAQNFEAAGILWDVSAFFDSIELADLVEF